MVDEELGSVWAVEEILRTDSVFMRVLDIHWDNGDIASAAIKDSPEDGRGMSVDWDKYSDPDRVRHGGRKPLERYGSVVFPVGELEGISKETCVGHDPKPENQAHSLVHGPKNSETRVLYRRALSICIVPPSLEASVTVL